MSTTTTTEMFNHSNRAVCTAFLLSTQQQAASLHFHELKLSSLILKKPIRRCSHTIITTRTKKRHRIAGALLMQNAVQIGTTVPRGQKNRGSSFLLATRDAALSYVSFKKCAKRRKAVLNTHFPASLRTLLLKTNSAELKTFFFCGEGCFKCACLDLLSYTCSRCTVRPGRKKTKLTINNRDMDEEFYKRLREEGKKRKENNVFTLRDVLVFLPQSRF